jgi:hypothetical protein
MLQDQFRTTGDSQAKTDSDTALKYAIAFEVITQALADRTYEGVAVEAFLAMAGMRSRSGSSINSASTSSPAVAPAKPEECVKVFRVEFRDNTRLISGSKGIEVAGTNAKGQGNVLWLNFGNEERSFEFLGKRLGQGLDTTVIKQVDVPASLLYRIRAHAVKEPLSSAYPNNPLRSADPFPDQFGLRGSWISEFEKATR